ncbi:hypothetical protein M3Y97_00634400 [Aphelenchoides bicaudatus]|nr:hypothetical protein M3Y97_00634400 [Aphelenchoides bicaudatus]
MEGGNGKASSNRRPNNDDRCALTEEKKRLVEGNNVNDSTKANERHASSGTVSPVSVTPPPLSVVINQPSKNNNNTTLDKESSGSSGTVVSSIGKPESSTNIQLPKKQTEKQQSQVASALPERMKQHKQLKKYASETSFRLSPAGTFQPPRRLNDESVSPPPPQAYLPSGAATVHASRHNSSGEHEVRTSHGRVFHVRAAPPSTRAGNGNTVVTKIQRRRQDSDDASGSVGSETTCASGTVTPVSRRMLRFKLRRPKSTGSMGCVTSFQANHSGDVGTHHSHHSQYDPSYTSATVHSLDSNQLPLTIHDMEATERRPSNFYIFDDESIHDFDDEIQDCEMNSGNSSTNEPKAGNSSTGPHKRVQVIITSEPSSSSISTMAGSDGNPPNNESNSNHQFGDGQRKTRFEVRHLDEKELMIDTKNDGHEQNHRASDMISSFLPKTGQIATTASSATISTTTTRVHPPLSQQSRFSPSSNTSPTSLNSLQSQSSPNALLTTTTTNFSSTSNHLLRSDGLPSRNPSIKSTGYADGGASARIRSLRRRISHTLLFLPEQRRVSTASAVSNLSCPTELSDTTVEVVTVPPPSMPHSNPTKRRYTPATQKDTLARQPLLIQADAISLGHPPVSATNSSSNSRRQSIQAGAIGFPSKRRSQFGRRSSQPEMTFRMPQSSQSSTSAAPMNHHRSIVTFPMALTPETTLTSVSDTTHANHHHRPDIQVSLNKRVSWMSMKVVNELDNITLMYSKHEKIPMKDFGSEIRAALDIDHLLNKAVLLLDLQETSLEEIFAKIIHEMDIQEPEFTSEQVRSVLFTQDAGNQFHILSRTVQSICTTGTVGGSFDYDQTWICALCMLNTVQHRHVAIARLSHPTNLGRTMQDLRFIIIVIAPSRAKGTKTALETTRTFATLFADMDIRQKLIMAHSVEVFRATLLDAAKELAFEQSQWRERKASIHLSEAKEQVFGPGPWYPLRGLISDFNRRKRHYLSDYLDGLRGHRTIQKLFSTIIFLYFACLLPAIAFGVLNDDNTNGFINVRKVVFAQAVGGIFFSVFGGQPMIILLTTVPLAIYIKVIHRISGIVELRLLCHVRVRRTVLSTVFNIVRIHRTLSAEEMFSLFIAIAFTVESIRAIHLSFVNNYHICGHNTTTSVAQNLTNLLTTTARSHLDETSVECHRDTSILYVLLMFGTLWLGMFLYNFRKTPYLTRTRREWLADYALPASVLIMSFLGAYGFSEIDKDMFKMRPDINLFTIPPIFSLPFEAYFICILLGFFLSFLFYMDQNITSAIVNNSQNKLKKGSAIHLDMLVVAILNCVLSVGGLPWMHGALPHSPLHLRALADVEERVAQGHVHEVIMNVRETRLASLVAHILILVSTFTLLPYPLRWIPTSVLHGLFLYMAFTSLAGNEMVERLLLLITEQPTHYIRRVPQRKVHLFTACQLIQLVILCSVGFAPYPFIEMIFPIVCFCFIPIRHTLVPLLVPHKFLESLDGRH